MKIWAKIIRAALWALCAIALANCQRLASLPVSDEAEATATPTPSTSTTRYLYVASGACYGGGVTTSTGSATVAKYDVATGERVSIPVDYSDFNPGDSIAALQDYDEDYLIAVVENTAGRRLDLIRKDSENSVAVYLTNTTAFASVLRSLTVLSDGGVLLAETASIEKFGSNKARVTQGANPYINAPAGSCATSTTNMVGTAELSGGKLLFAHAAATPNNKIGMISSTGYAAGADCLAAQTAPATTALPTALLVHSSGKLLVSYGSTTAGSNYVYSYTVNTTANTITGATVAYSNSSIVNGPSAMAEDTETGDVFVASALNTANTVDHFTFDSTAGTLTRQGASEVVPRSVFTRCVSGLVVTNE